MSPMIYITNDGVDVIVKVESDIPHAEGGKSYFTFRFATSQHYTAWLLATHLRERFEGLVKAIRQEEYEHGWRDAKAKKGSKRTWFSMFFGKRNQV